MKKYCLELEIPESCNVSYIEERIKIIESLLFLKEPITIWSNNPQLFKIGVEVLSQGYTKMFSGVGYLDHTQTFINGQTYYIITSEQYNLFSLLGNKKTVGTLWVLPTNSTPIAFPLFFDKTGIYFTPKTQITNLPIGSEFCFSDTIILVEEYI